MINVLIIGGIREIGENLSEFARLAGFDSHYAEHYSTLSKAQPQEGSHIILDLNMPGLDILKHLNCKHIQGYFFHNPSSSTNWLQNCTINENSADTGKEKK